MDLMKPGLFGSLCGWMFPQISGCSAGSRVNVICFQVSSFFSCHVVTLCYLYVFYDYVVWYTNIINYNYNISEGRNVLFTSLCWSLFNQINDSSKVELLLWYLSVIGSTVSEQWQQWCDWLTLFLLISRTSDLHPPSVSCRTRCDTNKHEPAAGGDTNTVSHLLLYLFVYIPISHNNHKQHLRVDRERKRRSSRRRNDERKRQKQSFSFRRRWNKNLIDMRLTPCVCEYVFVCVCLFAVLTCDVTVMITMTPSPLSLPAAAAGGDGTHRPGNRCHSSCCHHSVVPRIPYDERCSHTHTHTHTHTHFNTHTFWCVINNKEIYTLCGCVCLCIKGSGRNSVCLLWMWWRQQTQTLLSTWILWNYWRLTHIHTHFFWCMSVTSLPK